MDRRLTVMKYVLMGAVLLESVIVVTNLLLAIGIGR